MYKYIFKASKLAGKSDKLGLFIWYEDDPVVGNVLNLSSFISPRLDFKDYKEEDAVTTACPNFGKCQQLLGKSAVSFIYL